MHKFSRVITFSSGFLIILTVAVGGIAPASAVEARATSVAAPTESVPRPDGEVNVSKYAFKGATTKETENVLNAYIRTDRSTGQKYFDLQKAQKDGASEDLVELGEFFNYFAGSKAADGVSCGQFRFMADGVVQA